MENANRLGEKEYANRAQKRSWDLYSVGETELERRFNGFVAAYESFLTEKNERTTRAIRTLRKVQSKGIKQALTEWALSKTPTQGFLFLVERGHWEMTAEYLVVSMAGEFPPEVVASAREKLIDAGVNLNQGV